MIQVNERSFDRQRFASMCGGYILGAIYSLIETDPLLRLGYAVVNTGSIALFATPPSNKLFISSVAIGFSSGYFLKNPLLQGELNPYLVLTAGSLALASFGLQYKFSWNSREIQGHALV